MKSTRLLLTAYIHIIYLATIFHQITDAAEMRINHQVCEKEREITHAMERHPLPFDSRSLLTSTVIELQRTDFQEQENKRRIRRRRRVITSTPTSGSALPANISDSSKSLDLHLLNQPPMFSERAYYAGVYENAAPGSLVMAVVAIDVDSDPVRYFLLPPNGQQTTQWNMFRIDSSTGVLRLVEDNFVFTDDDFRFQVMAVDSHDSNDTASVRVHIIDINNHRPEFPQCSSYHPAVKENMPLKTPVVRVSAVDEDKGKNSEIVYSLVNSPGSSLIPFTINATTGLLRTRLVFNRDSPQNQKELRVIVKASDRGSPSLEGTCAFTVHVQDENDNKPSFDKASYIEMVPRNTMPGSFITWLSASDEDTDQNAAVTYLLNSTRPQDAGFFQVHSSTGALTLVKTLDQIKLNYEFHLRGIARDHGNPPRQDSVPVIITIKDSSTRPPTFVQRPNLTYFLPETYRDTEAPIAQVKAVSHSAHSSRVYYDIIHGSQVQTNQRRTFVLEEDGRGGALVKFGGSTVLDFETTPEYNITIRATTDDQTGAEIQFRITLLDQNDQVPIFYPVTKAVVQENSPIGTYVAMVTAIDADGTSPNNKITYRFTENSTESRLFTIDPESGRITTRIMFDREDSSRPSPFYTVTVIVEDGAPSDIRPTRLPNQAKERLTVEIGDENDSAPKFDSNGQYLAIVRENMDVGSKVLQVTAVDPDSDSRIRYEITAGNDDATFRIDADTGVIRLARQLDFELRQRFQLTVTASDGRYEVSRQVSVNVQNVNDVPPRFQQSAYQLTLRENFKSTLSVLKVRATDPDPVGSASIIYKLSGPGIVPDDPGNSVLVINNSGEIRVNKNLDRDEGTGGREVWEMSILAWDDGGSGLGSTVPFTLTLSDLNDNAPYIVQSNNTPAMIRENTNAANIRLPVEADDFDDHTQNGPPYSFQLDPDAAHSIRAKFRVKDLGTNRAEIIPLASFDREQQKLYRIPILVGDNPGANPAPLHATTFFTVVIGDENDNNMADGESVIRVFNYEGKMPASSIGRAYVTDPDDWDLPDKTFQWHQAEHTHFRLRKDTGEITLLHAAPNGSYPLKIKVYDKKFRSTALAHVTVHVTLLPRRAVVQSGSLRLARISAERFVGGNIAQPYSDTTHYHLLQTELSNLLKTERHNVEVFSVSDNPSGGVDVRYAAKGSPYYSRERLDGLVALSKQSLEERTGLTIEQVGINDCMLETTCTDSCYSTLEIYENQVHRVRTNTSSLIGVKTSVTTHCGSCEPPLDRKICLNDGTWNSNENRCECSSGFQGPNCQGLRIGFSGDGFAWFSGLTTCKVSVLSFDLSTTSSSGVLLYNGPLTTANADSTDFLAVQLVEGRLRVLLNLGSGTAVASPASPINNGKSHHVQLSWWRGQLKVELDGCDNSSASCSHSVPTVGSNRQLNVAAWPLQLGGTQQQLQQLAQLLDWRQLEEQRSFAGCLHNLTFNNKIYDLSSPAFGDNYHIFCSGSLVPVPVIGAGPSFLIAFIICLIMLMAIFLLMVVLRRKKTTTVYKEAADEMRDTIIQYEYEGGGEKDHTSFDLSVLQVARTEPQPNGGVASPGVKSDWSTQKYLAVSKSRADSDRSQWPPDDVRDYAYEGSGSQANSLSTLNSGTTDGELEFGYLERAGLKFSFLSSMYNNADDTDKDSDFGNHGNASKQSPNAESWC